MSRDVRLSRSQGLTPVLTSHRPLSPTRLAFTNDPPQLPAAETTMALAKDSGPYSPNRLSAISLAKLRCNSKHDLMRQRGPCTGRSASHTAIAADFDHSVCILGPLVMPRHASYGIYFLYLIA